MKSGKRVIQAGMREQPIDTGRNFGKKTRTLFGGKDLKNDRQLNQVEKGPLKRGQSELKRQF